MFTPKTTSTYVVLGVLKQEIRNPKIVVCNHIEPADYAGSEALVQNVLNLNGSNTVGR